MKKKTKLVIVLSLLLTICITGTTWALLQKTTDAMTNTFTASKGISISLREPSWDGYEFTDTIAGVPGTSKNPDKANAYLGIDQASEYEPGSVIMKDPTIKNSADSEALWMAIEVEFVDHNKKTISKQEFETMYGTLDISKAYTLVESNAKHSLYMYNIALDVNQSSEALFTKVVINEGIAFVKGALPSFTIKTNGYAIQKRGITMNEAQSELTNMSNK